MHRFLGFEDVPLHQRFEDDRRDRDLSVDDRLEFGQGPQVIGDQERRIAFVRELGAAALASVNAGRGKIVARYPMNGDPVSIAEDRRSRVP